jgi:hypothetical protein
MLISAAKVGSTALSAAHAVVDLGRLNDRALHRVTSHDLQLRLIKCASIRFADRRTVYRDDKCFMVFRMIYHLALKIA